VILYPIDQERDYGNAFTDAFSRGVDKSQAMAYSFAATIGDLTGVDVLSKWGLEGVIRNLDEAAKKPAQVESWDDVESLATFGTYVLEALGENAPDFLGMLGVAVGAAAIAPAAGGAAAAGAGLAGVSTAAKATVGKSVLRKLGPQAFQAFANTYKKRTAAAVGAGAYGFVQNTGESAIQQREEGVYTPATALTTGALKAALDVVGFERILHAAKLTGVSPSTLLEVGGKVIRQAGIAGGAEAVTEGLQTFIDQAVINAKKPDYDLFSEENLKELREAVIKGGIVGTTAGGALSSISTMSEYRAHRDKANAALDAERSRIDFGSQPPPETRERPAPPTEQQVIYDPEGPVPRGKEFPDDPSPGTVEWAVNYAREIGVEDPEGWVAGEMESLRNQLTARERRLDPVTGKWFDAVELTQQIDSEQDRGDDKGYIGGPEFSRRRYHPKAVEQFEQHLAHSYREIDRLGKPDDLDYISGVLSGQLKLPDGVILPTDPVQRMVDIAPERRYSLPITRAPERDLPIPESQQVIDAQAAAVIDPTSTRDTMLVTPGSPRPRLSLPPGAMERRQLRTQDGRQNEILTSNPQVAATVEPTVQSIGAAVYGNEMGKPADADGSVVVARNAEGVPVSEEATSPTTVADALSRAEGAAPAGGSVELSQLEYTIGERFARLAAEADKREVDPADIAKVTDFWKQLPAPAQQVLTDSMRESPARAGQVASELVRMANLPAPEQMQLIGAVQEQWDRQVERDERRADTEPPPQVQEEGDLDPSLAFGIAEPETAQAFPRGLNKDGEYYRTKREATKALKEANKRFVDPNATYELSRVPDQPKRWGIKAVYPMDPMLQTEDTVSESSIPFTAVTEGAPARSETAFIHDVVAKAADIGRKRLKGLSPETPEKQRLLQTREKRNPGYMDRARRSVVKISKGGKDFNVSLMDLASGGMDLLRERGVTGDTGTMEFQLRGLETMLAELRAREWDIGDALVTRQPKAPKQKPGENAPAVQAAPIEYLKPGLLFHHGNLIRRGDTERDVTAQRVVRARNAKAWGAGQQSQQRKLDVAAIQGMEDQLVTARRESLQALARATEGKKKGLPQSEVDALQAEADAKQAVVEQIADELNTRREALPKDPGEFDVDTLTADPGSEYVETEEGMVDPLDKYQRKGIVANDEDTGPAVTDPLGRAIKYSESAPPRMGHNRVPRKRRGQVRGFGPSITQDDVNFVDELLSELGIRAPVKILDLTGLNEVGADHLTPEQVSEAKRKFANDPTLKGTSIRTPTGPLYIVRNFTDAEPTDAARAMRMLVLGHEVGHSVLYAAEKALTPQQKARLQRAFEREKAEYGPAAWDGENGFSEWFADKVAARAWNKYSQPADRIFTRVARQLKKLWDAIAAKLPKRFTRNKRFEVVIRELRSRDLFDDSMLIRVVPDEFQDMNFLVREAATDLLSKADLRKLRNATRKILNGTIDSPIGRLFFTKDGQIRAIPGASAIADALYGRSRTSQTRVPWNTGVSSIRAGFYGWATKWDRKYDDAAKKTAFYELSHELPTEKLSPAAKEVREYLEQYYEEYLKLRIPGLGKVENYFPRAFNVWRIQTERDVFVGILARHGIEEGYAENVGAAISGAYNPEEYDSASLQTMTEGWQKERKLNDPALISDLVDSGFLNPDPVESLRHYIYRTTHRAEYERVFGMRREDGTWDPNGRLKHMLKAVPEGRRAEVLRLVQASVFPQIMDPKSAVHNAVAEVKAFESFRLLLGSGLATIPEVAGVFIRANGEIGAGEFAREIVGTVRDWQHAKELAEMQGVVRNVLGHSAATEMVIDPRMQNAGFFRKHLPKLFKWNGNDAITNFGRVLSVSIARQFIIRQAENIRDGVGDVERSKRYLNELGIQNHKAVLRWVRDGQNFWSFGLDPLVAADAKVVHNAVIRYVDESIVHPNASERPVWADHPVYTLFWHLKTFPMTFNKQIISGVGREIENRLNEDGMVGAASYVAPALVFFGFAMALGALTDELRQRIFTLGERGSLRAANGDASKMVGRWFDRAGFDSMPFVDALVEPKPANVAYAMGPTVSHLYELLLSDRPETSKLLRSIPGLSQFPTVRREIYDLAE